MSKTCTKCGIAKPVDEFFRRALSRDGRQNQCKACAKKYIQSYRENNPDKLAQYRTDNQKKLREYEKLRYAANREKCLAYQERYRQKNPEAVKRRTATWRKNNPQKAVAHVAIRRARLRAATIMPFTDSELSQRWAYYGNLCYLCGDPATQTDHVKPLAKGGAHALCNLRPICLACNKSKKDKWPFMPVLERGYR